MKVSALGEGSAYGFADENLRPPASVGREPRWPIAQPAYRPPSYPETSARQPGPDERSGDPVSLAAPGTYSSADEQPAEAGDDRYAQPSAYPATPSQDPSLRLGPARGVVTSAVGPVTVKPSATLACPIVSALDRWLADAVQPASMRWFGARVAEIKQISAYSCRGMNGNPRARISEHAFGNALDIAGFTLADGRYVSVQRGWKGLPEEQGFLRDVAASACQRFTTVLAPGSNIYHYNHIHVDLMRRASRRTVCKPAPVSGEEMAARAGRGSYAGRAPAVTGSLGASRNRSHSYASEADYDE